MIPGGESVVKELWALLVVACVVYFMRTASRIILLGSVRKLQLDDYIMTFTLCLFIITIVSIYIQCLWGNNYVYPEDVVQWTPEDFHKAIVGAEWGVAMETCKVTCVWCCKACLLILYSAMTKGLPKFHKAVMAVAVYVGMGYVIVMICYFFAWCRPFHKYYDTIPLAPEDSECMSYRKHMIMDACFNITSDAIMLCLPIPLLIRAEVPMAKKIALVGVFSLGGLVILCAILNRITNFTAPSGSLIYLNWYAGEAATAVIVANVPHLWPLLSRVFNLGSFSNKSSGPSNSNYSYPLKSSRSRKGGTRTSIIGGPSPLARRPKHDSDGYIPTGSEERFATSGVKDAQWEYVKEVEPSDLSDKDLEMNKGYTTTTVHGGRLSEIQAGHAVGSDEQQSGQTEHPWGGEKASGPQVGPGRRNQEGQIVKTVHIDQYASDDRV